MTEQRSPADFMEKLREFGQIIQQHAQAGLRRIREIKIDRPKLIKGAKIVGLLTLVGIGCALFFSLLVYWGVFGALPTYVELKEIENHNASEVYSQDGVLLGKYYVENRTNADFEEISPNVINALVATEDARFFEHSGIDVRAGIRVIVKSVILSDESSGGGSTLSQQLAKNLFPREERGILSMPVSKVKEMFIARRLENIYSKEELLRLYLNTVPFGENIFGIKVAAQRFFSKPTQELTVEEAAVLVGMLKANTLYNPVRNPERALQRRNTVLRQMVKYNYLDSLVLDSLTQMPLEVRYFAEGNNRGPATYFREHLRLQLDEILEDYPRPDGAPYNIYTDGLKIYTTIDAGLQQYAEEAVRTHMPTLQEAFLKNWGKRAPWGSEENLKQAVQQSKRYQSLQQSGRSDAAIEEIFNTPVSMRVFDWNEAEVEKKMTPLDSVKYYLTILNAGMLVMDPATGLVKAWVGGIDHQYFQYDHVKSRRQVGSTFKPIVYAQALRQGMLPCEYTANELTTYPEEKNWTPRNSDGEYGGVYSMEGALSKSVNTVTVGIIMRTGTDSVRMLANDMGLEGDIPPGPAIALGTMDASLAEIVKVYGAFANRGRRPSMHYLDRIETRDGEVIVEFERPDPESFPRVLATETSDIMIKMLQSVVDSGTAQRLRYRYGIYGEVAAKTGTTQHNTDGWFVGFKPNLVAGVWVGADNPIVHFRSMSVGQGSNSALPIWGEFMKKVYKDKRYNQIRHSKFPPMADSLLAYMQCPPYLAEMPIMVDFTNDPYYDRLQFYRQLGEYDEELREEVLQDKPRRENESLSEYNERIGKQLEREERKDERREKRKEFWNRVLFGDKEKEKKDQE